MAQYIDKSALVAEIERRIKTNKQCMLGLRKLNYYQGKVDALNDTISFLDNLEVKEVDLEKVIQEYFKGWEVNKDLGLVKPDGWSCIVKDLYNVAKYFYKLGLAQKGE